jgi:diaminopimelate decarboxylase
MSPKIIISGFYSGPSPSAGLGIARSMRQAFPQAHITGIDYWEGSSGLAHEVLDERIVFPSWQYMDQAQHVAFIKKELDDGAFYLSALDMEVEWLAGKINHHRLLTPQKSSLAFANKPEVKVGELLPFSQPEIFRDGLDDQKLYDFCRKHSWRVWVKGAFHGATFATSWAQLERARLSFGFKDDPSSVSYQSHIRGMEESICFSAYQGRLLDSVMMQKRVTTPEGKTWSGSVRAIDAAASKILAEAVRSMNWTGGGELELLRDEDDRLWLMEFNPRFPAWIHGSTLAGHNLPAALVGAAGGFEPRVIGGVAHAQEFTRVVLEIPVPTEIGLPRVSLPSHGQVVNASKYGGTFAPLEALVRAKSRQEPASIDAPALCPRFVDEVSRVVRADVATPHRVLLSETLESRLSFASKKSSLKSGSAKLTMAYSIKTCPEQNYLDQAFGHGLLAEAISMAEVDAALATGWQPNEIILNGPAKWWPRSMDANQGLRAVFCDSVEEFDRLIQSSRRDQLWGLRLKLPSFKSRFGIEVGDLKVFARLRELIRSMPSSVNFGIHVHLASNLIGNGHWQDAVQSSAEWAKALVAGTGKSISVFDMGGRYHPRDFETFSWEKVLAFVADRLPSVREVIAEPGRAISQDTMILRTSILDIRRCGNKIEEVVVDTCISDLPLIRVYPHRFMLMQDGNLTSVATGSVRVLGRVCMEDDIMSEGLALPENLQIGDQLIIADAGAYERSMSYGFGFGRIATAH